jgi:hypothetical protein
MRALSLPALLLLAACGHEAAWRAAAPPDVGPNGPTLPRRLTFNTGDDRSPAYWSGGGLIGYIRQLTADNRSGCIAYLPAEGGTVAASYCPPPPGMVDTFVSTWRMPVRSPDGTRVAFHWLRSARTSALASWTSELVVAAATNPRQPEYRVPLQHTLAEGHINAVIDPIWTAAGRIQFLGAYDSIWKIKSGEAEIYTDSALAPRAVVEVDPVAGTLTRVPGGDSAIAWTPGTGSEFWIVRRPARLLQVVNGVATERAVLSLPVEDMAFVNGVIVAALGDTLVEWIDPATGARGQIGTTGPVRRVSPAGGRRFVAEVERGRDQFGMPANLWLFELP